MRVRVRIPVCVVWLVLFPAMSGTCAGAATTEWQVVKSQHFLVYHANDAAFAARVAESAEPLYRTIADDLGFKRTSGFWLWDHRARILIYPTREAFQAACNAPGWAGGRASSREHAIAGCRSDGDRLTSVILPHEMAHLVLSEFVGEARLPQWLNEGFAQWEQNGRPKQAPAGGGPWIPLTQLFDMDVRRDGDTGRVHAYYAQCASVVGFLIGSYGGERFGVFCRALRDGKAVPQALSSAYPDFADGIEALERAWLQTARRP